jgi:nitrile hydratase
MGGMQAFGPVMPEPNEPPFHADWEKRALGLTLAMGATGQWSIDQSRSARESLPPARYLASSYYQVWLAALEDLMVERGLVTREEVKDGRAHASAVPVQRVLREKDVGAALAKGSPTLRPAAGTARFKPGDRVRARDWNPQAHTRLPRYCRGKPGTIVASHGCHVYADASAQGREEGRWLYGVRFEARDLWGPFTTASAVYVDCWEPYLEPA